MNLRWPSHASSTSFPPLRFQVLRVPLDRQERQEQKGRVALKVQEGLSDLLALTELHASMRLKSAIWS